MSCCEKETEAIGVHIFLGGLDEFEEGIERAKAKIKELNDCIGELCNTAEDTIFVLGKLAPGFTEGQADQIERVVHQCIADLAKRL